MIIELAESAWNNNNFEQFLYTLTFKKQKNVRMVEKLKILIKSYLSAIFNEI